VRWAHQVADRFPDGQLFLDLRGFHPDALVMSPADAVQGLLDALQVSPQRIPASLEARIGLYRSLLSGRRMLILLDNARDAEQVRPLLPGSPGCLVLVTSRHQLPGLIAAVGAHVLRLDLLSPAESRELLSRRLGADRMAAEPAAVAEILDRCRGLPLALAIAAARASTRPHLPLAGLANELCQTRDNLDGFEGEEAAADLRAVFSWSMHAVTPAAARLFRLLSVHTGPDLAAPAAASLAGLPLRAAQQLLGELTRAHLLTEVATGRYALHDLMRAYATELADGTDGADERRAATHRVLDHYLHTAHAAAVRLEPQRDPISLDPPAAGVSPVQLADLDHAHAWLAAELANLVTAVGSAYRTGFDEHAWRLAWSLAGVLDLRGHWQDQISVQATAAEAAVRLGNRQAELRIRMYLAFAQARLSAFDEAHLQLRRAVALADELGDPRGRAHTRSNLGWLRLQQLQHRAALDDYRQAHELYREAGYAVGEARMLNAIGWIHAQLEEYEPALRHCQAGLALMVEHDDRQGQGMAWDSIGYAHHHLGDPRQALACYQTALALHREVGDRYLESNTLVHIGDAQAALDDLDRARATWRQALSILDELGHPDAEEVRAKLEPGPASSPVPAS
jgi:tetratricopeptide (TPR) repeat protein